MPRIMKDTFALDDLDSSAAQFEEDVGRINIFTNGDETQDYVTTDGRAVPSLSKVVANVNDMIQPDLDAIAATLPAAQAAAGSAAQSAGAAADSAQTAANDATTAQSAATATHADAIAAADDAERAEASKDAAGAARDAAVAAQTGVQQNADAASTAAANAQASASAAQAVGEQVALDRDAVDELATEAAGSAVAAGESATAASTWATEAGESATAASENAIEAAASAELSAGHAAAIDPASFVQRAGDTMTGPLVVPTVTLSGIGSRLIGDFSNATATSRTYVQTSQPNARTALGVMPAGSGDGSAVNAWATGDVTNGPYVQLLCSVLNGASDINSSLYPLRFLVNAGERMRIDASGNVGLSQAQESPISQRINGATWRPVGGWDVNSIAGTPLALGVGTTSMPLVVFYYTGAAPAAVVGSITTNGTGVSYYTTSDYRLKRNVQPLAGALDIVRRLRPVSFAWEIDGSAGTGLIAHELQAEIPQAVSGAKDETNDDGSIKPQCVDYSKLVPYLVATIHELIDRVRELERRGLT